MLLLAMCNRTTRCYLKIPFQVHVHVQLYMHTCKGTLRTTSVQQTEKTPVSRLCRILPKYVDVDE